jgi:hypothetical protein
MGEDELNEYRGKLDDAARSELNIRGKVRRFESAEGSLSPLDSDTAEAAAKDLRDSAAKSLDAGESAEGSLSPLDSDTSEAAAKDLPDSAAKRLDAGAGFAAPTSASEPSKEYSSATVSPPRPDAF